MPENEKLFYSIGEAAQLLNVKPYVLRYWESEFRRLNPQKTDSGQRTYRKKDLQVAQTIHRLLYSEKFTIAGAIQKLEEIDDAGLDPLPGSPLNGEAVPETAGTVPSGRLEEFRRLLTETKDLLQKYE